MITRAHIAPFGIFLASFCTDAYAQTATPDSQFKGSILFDRAGEKSQEARQQYVKNQPRLMMIARNSNGDELDRRNPTHKQETYVLFAPVDSVAEISWEIEGDTGVYILWPRQRYPRVETSSFQYLTAATVKEKVLPDDVVDNMRNRKWDKASKQISDFITILQTSQIAENLNAQAQQKNIAHPDVLTCSLLSDLLGGKGKMGDNRVEPPEDNSNGASTSGASPSVRAMNSLEFERKWLHEYLKQAGSLSNESDKRKYLADALDCWATFAAFKYSKKKGTFGSGSLNKAPRIPWVKADRFPHLSEDMGEVWNALSIHLVPEFLNLTAEQVRKLKKLKILPEKLRAKNAQSVDLFQLQELIRALKASNPLRDSSAGQ